MEQVVPSLISIASVYYYLRGFIGFQGQLAVRATCGTLQQYCVNKTLRAISNTACEFRVSVKYCCDGHTTVRPLIERLIVVPLYHKVAFQLIWRYLNIVAQAIPEEYREATIRSLVQIPIDFRGLN